MIKKMSESMYNADSALRQSDFKKFMISPALLGPDHTEEEFTGQKDYFNLGSLVDCLFIEPEFFPERFAEFSETKGLETAKALKFIAGLDKGVMAYTPEMLKKAKDMVTILKGWVELPPREYRQLSAFTIAQGVPIKARCDWYGSDGWIYDLKTTADLKWWNGDAIDKGYDIQSCWYKTCFDEWEPKGFRFIVIKSSPPHNVIFRECRPETENSAAEKIISSLQQYKKCEDNGIWTWHDSEITYDQF